MIFIAVFFMYFSLFSFFFFFFNDTATTEIYTLSLHDALPIYHQQKEWPDTRLPRHSAVVDFLYHPQAEFWADHHETSFLTDQLRADFEARKDKSRSKDESRFKDASRFYDKQSGSCAS